MYRWWWSEPGALHHCSSPEYTHTSHPHQSPASGEGENRTHLTVMHTPSVSSYCSYIVMPARQVIISLCMDVCIPVRRLGVGVSMDIAYSHTGNTPYSLTFAFSNRHLRIAAYCNCSGFRLYMAWRWSSNRGYFFHILFSSSMLVSVAGEESTPTNLLMDCHWWLMSFGKYARKHWGILHVCNLGRIDVRYYVRTDGH